MSATGDGVHTTLADLVRLRGRAWGFSLLPRQPITSILAGPHGSRLRGRGLDFEELRGYRPGDDVRAIDWKATARLRRPQLRVYTEERDRPTLLIVDQRSTMFFGSRARMKSVVAAEVAALSAWRVFAQGDRVGALILTDDEIVHVAPQRTAAGVTHLLEQVVRANRALSVDRDARGAPERLPDALEKAARLAHHDHLVVGIGDFDGLDDRARRAITRLSRHNDALAVLVSDPIGRLLPRAGRLAFSRDGQELLVDAGHADVRARFAARFDELLEETRAFLRRLDVPLLTVTPDTDLVRQVARQLGAAVEARR